MDSLIQLNCLNFLCIHQTVIFSSRTKKIYILVLEFLYCHFCLSFLTQQNKVASKMTAKSAIHIFYLAQKQWLIIWLRQNSFFMCCRGPQAISTLSKQQNLGQCSMQRTCQSSVQTKLAIARHFSKPFMHDIQHFPRPVLNTQAAPHTNICRCILTPHMPPKSLHYSQLLGPLMKH